MHNKALSYSHKNVGRIREECTAAGELLRDHDKNADEERCPQTLSLDECVEGGVARNLWKQTQITVL